MLDDREGLQEPETEVEAAEHAAAESDPEVATEALPAKPVRRSMFSDPVVRALAFVAGALVALFLATVVGVLASGLLAPSGPRTLTEKELASARSAVSAGSTDTAVWGQYVASLVDAGQYGRARSALGEARESLNDSSSAEFSLAEARILLGEDKNEAGIEAAKRTMSQLQKVYDAAVAKGGLEGSRAEIRGLHDNYYSAVLLVAVGNERLGNWDEAIEHYDIYIAKFRGAADILVDRGNAKAESGDTEGAEKDYREALRFGPDNAEALEALDRIGAGE